MHPDDQLKQLLSMLLEQQASLQRIVKALERTASANDDAAGVVASVLPEIRTAMAGNRDELAALKALLPSIQQAAVEDGKNLAVLSNNVKDVQVEVREVTNKFRRYDPSEENEEVSTQRTVGKVTITVWRHARRFWPLVATGSVGAAIVHALHVLHILK